MDVTAPQTKAGRMMPVDSMMPVAPPMAVGCFARVQTATADSQANDNPAVRGSYPEDARFPVLGSSRARDTRPQA